MARDNFKIRHTLLMVERLDKERSYTGRGVCLTISYLGQFHKLNIKTILYKDVIAINCGV